MYTFVAEKSYCVVYTVGKKRAGLHFTITLVNLTQPMWQIESQIFTIFVPVLRKLCRLGLKILQLLLSL